MRDVEPDVAIAVRRLGAADLPMYKQLRDHALASFPEAFTSDAATELGKSAESYLPRLGLDRHDGGHFVLGAFSGSTTLIGALGCERGSRAKVHHIGHVTGMMVLADAHRRGAGKALLEACIGAARSCAGLEMLTLNVTASNDAAVQLYERSGFTRYGTLPRALKLGVRHLDKHQMVLML